MALALAVLAVTGLWAYLPARRASRINPMQVFRHDSSSLSVCQRPAYGAAES